MAEEEKRLQKGKLNKKGGKWVEREEREGIRVKD